MRRFLLYFVILVAINSCNDVKTEQANFLITKSIYSKGIKTKPVFYSKRNSVIIINNNLVALEKEKEPLFNIFSIPECAFLGALGKNGRGPNEFGFIDARSLQSTQDGFCINDLQNGFLFIKIESLATSPVFNIRKYNLPGEMFTLNDAFYLKDSLICGSPYNNNDFMYVKYNFKNNKVEYFGNYPDLYPDRKNDFWQIYSRKTTVKPDGKLFASFFAKVKMFRIYDNKGKMLEEKIMKVQKLYNGKAFNFDVLSYYGRVKSTEKYIYAYCSNFNLKTKKFINSVLEIWDWQGNPIALVKLDKQISAFDVLKDDKYLYAIDRSTMDSIFVYNLNFLP